MSDRKEDFSFSFSSDQYNLKPSTEDNFYNYSWSDDGPKVLTTMRNMFAEEKSDEYELVYHNFSEEEQLKILNQMKQKRRQMIQSQNFQRLHPPGPPRVQNFQQRPTSSHQNPPSFQSQNFQNFAPALQATAGSPEIEDDDDHEEEEDHDQDEDDSVEDNRIVHHCPECSKKYTSERRLKHHIQVHKNADAYKCPKCGYCYQSPDSLRRHWKKTPNCNEVPVQRPIKSEVVDSNSSN